ncbi:NAC domain-containing protein 8 [Apostasia shenzhenica]|uniref:NAC domain-containing protein 8 n=1 Tax=Apostasia shenzhenica TaxID=1088818 RepID=A0A2I0ADG7_9ASPA|nr:NAC domain-containing protein 8 [Apostasia shenzhenica]
MHIQGVRAEHPERDRQKDDLDHLPLKVRGKMLLSPGTPCSSSNASSEASNSNRSNPEFAKLSSLEWPDFPRGVKFDPSDEELLSHLLAEVGKGEAKRHPLISKFIISLNEDHGFGIIHPQFLPGIKKDGSMSYFFHPISEMHKPRQIERQKKYKNSFEVLWHTICRTKTLLQDGIHQGSKDVMAFYARPANGGKFEVTNWVMHQYHIISDGVEEDLVVSKIFYQIPSKRDEQDTLAYFMEDSVAELAGVRASPFVGHNNPVEILHAQSILFKGSSQVVDHDRGDENAGDLGCPSFFNSQKSPTSVFEKAAINSEQHMGGALASDDLTLRQLESTCEVTDKDNMCDKVEINCKKKNLTEKKNDGFPMILCDHDSSINRSIFEGVKDDTCFADEEPIRSEDSCGGVGSEQDVQKIVVDPKNKHQYEVEISNFRSCGGHISGETLDTGSKLSGEAEILLVSATSTEHRIVLESASNFSTVLGLPVGNVKSEPSEGIGTENISEKVTNKKDSVLPAILPVNIKAEPSEELETYNATKENTEKLSSPSLVVHPTKSSKVNPREILIPQYCTSKEGKSISKKTCVPEETLTTMISDLDELLSATTGQIDQHPEVDANLSDGFLFSSENLYRAVGSQPLDQPSNTRVNFLAGDNQGHAVLFRNLLKEPKSILSTCNQIHSDNIRGNYIMKTENNNELPDDFDPDVLDHIPLRNRLHSLVSEGCVLFNLDERILEKVHPQTSDCSSVSSVIGKASLFSIRRKRKNAAMNLVENALERYAPEDRVQFDSGYIPGNASTSDCCSVGSVNDKTSLFSIKRKRKKTATDSLEKALEEDAPGLLQVLLDRGIAVEEIKLYGDAEENDLLGSSLEEDSFQELETVMAKLFSERLSPLRFSVDRPMKGSRAVYCLACLLSLIEQARYLQFRTIDVEWGWCRDLHSFIFIFRPHNRIVLERPEYGYATYFFELVGSLAIDWQIKRLVTAMKLTNCSRVTLLENKPLLVGEDLTEGEGRVLQAYGWTPNTGLGTMLNYCDRVVHDRRNEMFVSDWRAKIGRLLMSGYDCGRMVVPNVPKKASEYLTSQKTEIKLEF